MSTQAGKPMWHVYVRKGVAFVPNVAQTAAGFYIDVEPVRVTRLDDPQSLASAIEQAMAAGNPRVPTPTQAAFPKPVILKPAGVKSWSAFVDQGACFTVFCGESQIEITETGRSEDGDWMTIPSLNEKLAPGSSALAIALRILERVGKRDDLGGAMGHVVEGL